MIIFITALIVRPYFTDENTRRYWMPALMLRIFGAVAVGFLYQFYYSGGDTFTYHTWGSRIVWDAFMEDPLKGFLLLMRDTTSSGLYKYTSHIYFYTDPGSFAVIQVAALIDFFTFSTYSATAAIFAVISFVGLWMMFQAFYQMYPHLHKQFAFATFFIPSVIFWGSGLLKDTLTLACLGIATYQVYRIFIRKNFFFGNIFLLLVALFGLFSIKIYILLAFLPSLILWVFMENLDSIRSQMLKLILFPSVLIISLLAGYFAILKAGSDDKRYSLENISRTAQITAYDIRYLTGKNAGSGYTLGELDGTWRSMIVLAPAAINVSLFRPYLWEVRNPLMLLSALESLTLFLLTLFVLFHARHQAVALLSQPTIMFAIVFSLVFAFSVGVATFNFGTLTRYKIPLLPFYSIALILIYDFSKSAKKDAELDITE